MFSFLHDLSSEYGRGHFLGMVSGFASGLAMGAVIAIAFAVLALVQWRRATALQLKLSADQPWEPLKDKLAEFEDLVRATYEREGRERFHLEKEIASLTSETHSLARSLRGDSKVQGDWGEVLLENILESSGLREGFEFDLQASFVSDEGRQLRPDVVIKLPGERVLIIDAKVSLTAWDRYCNADDDDERTVELAAHVQSLRRHIQTLGAKRYQQMNGVVAPEFVFLFTRIEPAWIEALKADPTLVDDAGRASVVVVSPTTLFAVLKTVSSLWGRERQNRNALEIADEAGKLYDKFVLFAGDLLEIESDLEKAVNRIGLAKRKLTEGPGNLAGRAEKIRLLGAKATKKLSDVLPPELEGN